MDTSTVVLIRDERWPRDPGVCCWRANVQAAFTELGYKVLEIDWSPLPASPEPVDASAPAARPPSVPGVVVRFIGRAIRATGYALWRLARRLARPFIRRMGQVVRRALARRGQTIVRERPRHPVTRPSSDGRPDPRLTGLTDARLVLAESPEIAIAAVHSGVPGRAVWLLAVPPERATPGEPVPWAADLREAAPMIGGLVADSLDAAGILERVTGTVRTVVFPPLAADRPCPHCEGAAAAESEQSGPDAAGAAGAASHDGEAARGSGGGEGRPAEERAKPVDAGASTSSVTAGPTERRPDETGADDGGLWDDAPHTVPSALALWRELLAEQREGRAPVRPYSYAAARLLGTTGVWARVEREPWGPSPSPDTARQGADDAVRAWTAAAQRDGARELLRHTEWKAVVAPERGPRQVRIFGHDMKFMQELAELLDERPDLEVTIDEWRSAGVRNEGISENLLRTGQTLVAEWARPNAVWLSEVKRPDQMLIVRLHRFEIETEYPRQIRQEAVDAFVYIAPHMGRRIAAELGWPKEKLVYIPNYLPARRLDRPKYAGANFTLGMVGIVPGLKRFDLALDLLAEVRKTDPRFTLLVRSQTGWAHKPSWENPRERREAQRAMERIDKDPLLRGAVVFDAFGRDMAAWFRKVGHILSLSDVEGSHAALSEGMASGAVPVIRGWDGAAEAYGEHWLCDSLDAAVKQVLMCADEDHWRRRSAEAKREVNERFDPEKVVQAWVDLAHGHLEAAREHFAAWAGRL